VGRAARRKAYAAISAAIERTQAFEAAARSENFTRAAEELGVSQAAVSQHVKGLEVTLGVRLFSRDGRRLVITGAG
jgi:LysR family glycine cleavage system transcriptional activator